MLTFVTYWAKLNTYVVINFILWVGCVLKKFNALLCGKVFLYTFVWKLFVMGLEQIPGMNLQMSISAKVDNIITKIAEYSLIDQTFANFHLF